MIKDLYTLYIESSGVSTDTRFIAEGNLFFALKGDNFDGNQYAHAALAAGARAAVIDDSAYHVEGQTILVDDVLLALQHLARYHRRRLSIPIIGITGSNGKTTTKELLYAVLVQKYKTYATKGNLNNHIGVPLSVLSIRDEDEIAIIEMGANHQGEIDFLCSIAQPDYGLITNIGKAHLEGFGGIEGVKKGKSELYRHLAYTGGTIFLNEEDNVLCNLLPRGAKVVKCLQGLDYELVRSFPRLEVTVNGQMLKSKLAGAYNIGNMLMALAIGQFFGLDQNKAIAGIESYNPTNNRSQIAELGSNTYILDAYNANPTSMAAAIGNMRDAPSIRKVLILGDMLELGEAKQFEHQEILKLIESISSWSQVYTVGPIFHSLASQICTSFLTTGELKAHLAEYPLTDSLILVKGSRSIKLEQLLS